MFTILAAEEDARVAGAVEQMLGEAGRAAPFASDATLLLCTAQLETSAKAHALLDAALSAWGEGRLVIVRVDGALVPIGFRDVPVIEWQAEEAVGATGGDARAVFVATLREILKFAAQGGEPPQPTPSAAAATRAPSGALLFASGGVIALLAALALGFALTRELSRTPSSVSSSAPKAETAATAKTATNTKIDLEALGQKSANVFDDIQMPSPDAGSSLVSRPRRSENENWSDPVTPALKGKTARERAADAARKSGILAILGAQKGGEIAGIFGHSPNDWTLYAEPRADVTRIARVMLVRSAREAAGTRMGDRRRRITVLADNVEHQDARLTTLEEEIAKLPKTKGGKGRLATLTAEREALAKDVNGLEALLREELDSAAVGAPSPKRAGASAADHVTMGAAIGRARDPSFEEAFAGVATINDGQAKRSLEPQPRIASAEGTQPARLAAIPAAAKPSAPPPSSWGWWFAGIAAAIAFIAALAWIAFARRRGEPVKATMTPEVQPASAAIDIPAGVFASYARADSQRVDQLVEAIELSGVPVWVDRKRLPGGVRWPAEIVKAIRESKALVVFCSSSAFSSDDVFREVHLAARFRKNLIPVALDGAQAPDAFLFYLAPQNFIPASDAAEVRRAIGALLGSQAA